MKYSIYLLLAGFLFFSCSQGEDSTEANSEETTTEQTKDQLSTEVINNDATANQTPAEPEGGNAKMEFEATEWDFGQIEQGDKVEHVFKFKNTGTEPLIISNAKGSCGCTVPSYPKEPIAVGETGEIQVVFDSKGKKGTQRKTVTITANTTPNRTTLNITTEINVPEGAGVAN